MIRLTKRHFSKKFEEAKRKAMAIYKNQVEEESRLTNLKVEQDLTEKVETDSSVEKMKTEAYKQQMNEVLDDFSPIETSRIKANFGTRAKLRVEHGTFIYAKPQLINYSQEGDWLCIYFAHVEPEFERFKRYWKILFSVLFLVQLKRWNDKYNEGKGTYYAKVAVLGGIFGFFAYNSFVIKRTTAKKIEIDALNMEKLRILFQNGKQTEIPVSHCVSFNFDRKHIAELKYRCTLRNRFKQVFLNKKVVFDPNLFKGIGTIGVNNVEFDGSYY